MEDTESRKRVKREKMGTFMAVLIEALLVFPDLNKEATAIETDKVCILYLQDCHHVIIE